MCAEADLRGDVTIGGNAIIHPKVRILAYGGPIVIGEGCLIEEQTVIVNRLEIFLCNIKSFQSYFNYLRLNCVHDTGLYYSAVLFAEVI